MSGYTGVPCSACSPAPLSQEGGRPRLPKCSDKRMAVFQGALVFQWILKLVGMQADIRQRALESICIAKVSAPFVLFTQLRNREKGREGGRREGRRRENTGLCQPPELWPVSCFCLLFTSTYTGSLGVGRVGRGGLSFCRVSGHCYWLQNHFDNCFIKYF